MKQTLWVGLGGLIGAIARYKIGGIILHHSEQWRFPLGTFCVNVAGCFILGTLAGLAEKQMIFTPDLRLFLFTGVLGGFTTFSAFAAEGLNLFRRGDVMVALTYALLSVLCGLLAVWVGMKLFGTGIHRT
ncbi:MAG: fluoride efflux transporter CrcB [Verrucomicrobiota bacterium]|nr:fluoride efflux transporter CrcB [Verrucomicrobiota bacterium]